MKIFKPLIALLLVNPFIQPLHAEARHALAIGNGNYQPYRADLNKLTKLRNPEHDAKAMADLFTALGFDRVLLKQHVQRKTELKLLINRFAKKLPSGATAIVYYSGHGIGAQNKNYLLPTRYSYSSEADVTEYGISAEWLLQRLSLSKAKRIILILDACRDHLPLNEGKGPEQESFGDIAKPQGYYKETLIAYASGKGEVAYGDRDSSLSLYTSELIPALKQHAHLPLELALSDTTSKVRQRSSDPNNSRRFPAMQSPRYDSGLGTWCLASSGCMGMNPIVELEKPLIDGKTAAELAELRRKTAVALNTPEQYDEVLSNGERIRMHLIPGGRFNMGSVEVKGASDERPQHPVTLEPFYLAETELTQAQWSAVMAANNPAFFKGADHPVEQVSWDDIQTFLTQLGKGYRLPSESQWEYAARAGSSADYHWGNSAPECKKGQKNSAVFGGYSSAVGRCKERMTQPVGFSAPNAFGIKDMHGNVWEWVQDCYESNYDKAPKDGTAWVGGKCDFRVLRGGSWLVNPEFLRAANRVRLSPDLRVSSIGFRLLRAAPLKPTVN